MPALASPSGLAAGEFWSSSAPASRSCVAAGPAEPYQYRKAQNKACSVLCNSSGMAGRSRTASIIISLLGPGTAQCWRARRSEFIRASRQTQPSNPARLIRHPYSLSPQSTKVVDIWQANLADGSRAADTSRLTMRRRRHSNSSGCRLGGNESAPREVAMSAVVPSRRM